MRVAITVGADTGLDKAMAIAVLVGGEVVFVEETDMITHDAWSSLPRFSARWPGKSRLQDISITGNSGAADVRVWVDEMVTWDDMMSHLVERAEPPIWKHAEFASWKRQPYRAGQGMQPNPAHEVGRLRRGVHLCGRDARRWKRRRFIQALRKEALG